MDFLNNIQCKNEPFASTGGKDLYLIQPVSAALEKLTHSIRLGAGLHVIIGTPNSGKTTLIEQLAEQFNTDTNTAVIIINNPRYSNLQQFFIDIASVFRPIKEVAGVDNKKIQDAFNTFLYKQCIKERRRVLLLIDNGHDLPDYCIQGLNDFYDHHANCRRMLQTVICGEPPLQKQIKSIYGISEQVALTINLKNFSFKETRELIRFHVGRAAADPNSPPSLFSALSQWAIYLLTRGNPKQVLDLCHLIVISLAIEDRKKADWFLTLRSANMLYPERARKLQFVRVGSISSLVVLMLIFGIWSENFKTVMAPEPVVMTEAGKDLQPAPQPSKEEAAQSEPEAIAETAAPQIPAEKVAAVIEEATQPVPETAAEKIAALSEEKVQPVPETAADKVAVVSEEAIQPVPETAAEATVPTVPAEKVAVATAPTDKIITVIEKKEPGAERATPAPVPEPAEKIARIISPAIKERREVRPGDTFLVMIQKVYGPGHLKPHFIKQVIAANPQLEDTDSLAVGDEVFFPVLIGEDEMAVAVQEEEPVAVVKESGSLVSKKLKRELQPVDSPDLIGKLTVQPGETLGKLIRGIYGPFSFNPDYTSKVLAVNTHLKNPDSLEVGETLYFPDLPIRPEIGLPAKPQTVSSREDLPEFLGEIAAIEDETFGDMVRRIYGPYSFNDENVEKVLRMNPGLKNPDLLSVGQKVRFPTILVGLTPKVNEVWWVKIISLDNLQSAYRFLRVYSKWSPPMLIIPSRNNSGKVVFNILLQHYFTAEQSARKAVNDLPGSINADARVLHGLDSNTFYYWIKNED